MVRGEGTKIETTESYSNTFSNLAVFASSSVFSFKGSGGLKLLIPLCVALGLLNIFQICAQKFIRDFHLLTGKSNAMSLHIQNVSSF